jgi:hypothetical protein
MKNSFINNFKMFDHCLPPPIHFLVIVFTNVSQKQKQKYVKRSVPVLVKIYST